jgi:hypothetical protein
MDKPLTPVEHLADAVTGLTRRLEQLRDALDLLAYEMMLAETRQRRQSAGHDASDSRAGS